MQAIHRLTRRVALHLEGSNVLTIVVVRLRFDESADGQIVVDILDPDQRT
jgi:hypothetical protein